MVGGNHELFRTNDPSWLEFLQKESLVTLLTPQPTSYLDADLYGLSWVGAKIHEEVAAIKIYNPSRYNILVLHAGIKGLSPTPDALEESFLHSLGFNYVALGHIHQPYNDNLIHNPGSLETNSTTEYQWPDRGFFVIENGKAEKVINPKRRFIFTDSLDVEPDPEAICIITTDEPKEKVLTELEPKFKYVKIKPKRIETLLLTAKGKQRDEIEKSAFEQLNVDFEYAKRILSLCLQEESYETILEEIC